MIYFQILLVSYMIDAFGVHIMPLDHSILFCIMMIKKSIVIITTTTENIFILFPMAIIRQKCKIQVRLSQPFNQDVFKFCLRVN